MLRMLDAKNVRLDVFEAESCVGFFIHSFCSKGAFFVRRTGMYIYSYSDHVIPARNGWRVWDEFSSQSGAKFLVMTLTLFWDEQRR